MSQRLRVLIVEDSDADAALLLAELERGGYVVEYALVETAGAMRTALAERTWDVIVSDYKMPTFDGIGALSVLKESGLDVPLIIASGTIGEETAVEALRAGACDFLLKGRLARLIPAIDRETREAEGRRQRRAAEAALSQTRERMQFALTAAGVGFWESDPITGAMSWSEVLEHLHGLPTGGFAGTREAFIGCVHPDDRQRVSANLSGSMLTPHDAPLEYRTTWPDGSTHWIAGIGRTFFDPSGRPIRAAGVGIDVTAQKSLEEQVRQSQKMEAIGGLAAGVAHDFNNLLTVVTGYCELLAHRFADDLPALQDLSEIRRASASATSLTRQLLAFSRRQVVEPRPVALNSLLEENHTMMRRLVEENVRIDLRLGDDLPRISIDPGQLEQVVFNQVINARDAMPEGGRVTIETRAARADDPDPRTRLELPRGDFVLMSVTDNGRGMTPEVKARMFEPFFTTKERGRGTGLGLATVYGIVKQSSGHIWVDSEVGTGTTFRVYWPVSAATDSPAPAGVKPGPVGLHGTETILVVEDEAPLRALTERILRQYGYGVLLAANGDEAERLCVEHTGPIHVALMDVLLPGKSGAAVAEWMAVHRPEVKIIFLSGYADTQIFQDGVLKAGTAFLQKPHPTDALLTKIREVLSSD